MHDREEIDVADRVALPAGQRTHQHGTGIQARSRADALRRRLQNRPLTERFDVRTTGPVVQLYGACTAVVCASFAKKGRRT